MKRINKFYGIAMTALVAGALSSCSNELSEPTVGGVTGAQGVNLVHAPEFTAWSGDKTILPGNSDNAVAVSAVYATSDRNGVFTDLGVNSNFFKICDFGGGKSDWMAQQYPTLYQYFDNAPATTDRGEYVSTDEYNFVMDYLAKHPDEGYTECDLTTYFIQNVGSSEQTYTVSFIADNGTVHHTADIKACTQMNYLTIGNSHVPDYNATDGKRALVVDVPVVDPAYKESYGTQDNTKYDAYLYYYITYNGVTSVYLCFDYKVKKYDNGQLDYQGDGIYSDWVIKLTPADGSVVTPPSENSDDTGTGDGGDEPETGDTGSGDKPEEKPVLHNDEVEVNYAINDVHMNGDQQKYENADLWTKLSIHVRKGTNVRITIPLPITYLCQSDDLVVLQDHNINFSTVQTGHQVVYNISDGKGKTWTVSLDVNLNTIEDKIVVTTDGIDQDLIDYLYEKNGDGINFEIWNYFQTETVKWIEGEKVVEGTLTDEEYASFKGKLDDSKIEFLEAKPSYYINAFNDHNGDGVNTWDCIVEPLVEDYFGKKDNMYHLNQGKLNTIYYYVEEDAIDEGHNRQ